VVACMCAVWLPACRRSIQRNDPGPGGLPRGIVEEGRPTLSGEEYPVYSGAIERSRGVYETTDSIAEVRSYYAELLGMEPERTGQHGDVLRFETAEFTLVLLPLTPSAGGGTEIRFTPKNGDN
jgi:hypothetical protein